MRQNLWSYETKGWVDAAPAIYRGMLFVCSKDGYVYAFGNTEDTPEKVAQQEDRNIGIVTYNEAKVYAQPSHTSDELLDLNDGVKLPFLKKSDGWYQIHLPNGQAGWMDKNAFAQFHEEDGLWLNDELISKTQKISLPEGAEYPIWSPDGQNIAFLKRLNLTGRYWKAHEIWVADLDAHFLRVCRGSFYNPHISWSLDSRWLAFEGYESDTSYVWIALRNGFKLTKLTTGSAPSWSPKAHRIAFRRWGDKADSVWRINIDKTELTELIVRPIKGRATLPYLLPPVWEPGGESIATGFDGWHYESNDSRIVIAGINGKVAKEVLTDADRVNKINWSPDKKHLAYVISGNPGEETVDKLLYLRNLTNAQKAKVFEHTSPAWSPDGKRLAFIEREKCMGLKWKVWILNLDDFTKLPLARTNINLSSIAWLPDGNRVCLWATSAYLRDGEYKPAETTGWVVWIAEDEN